MFTPRPDFEIRPLSLQVAPSYGRVISWTPASSQMSPYLHSNYYSVGYARKHSNTESIITQLCDGDVLSPYRRHAQYKRIYLVNSRVLFTIRFASLAGELIVSNYDIPNIVSYYYCWEDNRKIARRAGVESEPASCTYHLRYVITCEILHVNIYVIHDSWIFIGQSNQITRTQWFCPNYYYKCDWACVCLAEFHAPKFLTK